MTAVYQVWEVVYNNKNNNNNNDDNNCGRQEEPAILISRLLLCMCHMNVASIRLDFH